MDVKFSGERLKEIRLNADMSQTELSETSGVNQSNISKMERGAISDPSDETLIQIAAALSRDGLHYTVDDFLVVEKFSGEELRKIRVKKKISQTQMAEDLYVPRPTISRYETGTIKNPSPLVLQKICDYLQINLEDLFSSQQKKQEKTSETTDQKVNVHVHVKIDWGLTG